jgi:hypothetical protein
MPNWKKVIISGSDASLNSLNLTNGATGSFTGSFIGDGSELNGVPVNVTNNTNNYILTATGNSDINGESTLTFNGTNLQFGGNNGIWYDSSTLILGDLEDNDGSLEFRTYGNNTSATVRTVQDEEFRIFFNGGKRFQLEDTLLIIGKDHINVGTHSTIAGGESNTINGTADCSFIGGGYNNETSGEHSTIGGGTHNLASNHGTTVGGGGACKVVCDAFSTPYNVELGNTASGEFSTVAGGFHNRALGDGSFIGGGGFISSFIGVNCFGNLISGNQSTIGGGASNEISTDYGTIGGGSNNEVSEDYSGILGGCGNTTSGNYSTIGGGRNNQVSGNCSGILGGNSNTVTGTCTFAIGSNLAATCNDYTYVNNLCSNGVVDSQDGYYGYVRSFIHTSFFFKIGTSVTPYYYIPIAGYIMRDSIEYYNQSVANYDGRVRKVIMKSINGSQSVGSIDFRKTINNSQFTTDYAGTIVGGTYTREFSNGQFDFSEGDHWGLRFKSDKELDEVSATIIVEYNIPQ